MIKIVNTQFHGLPVSTRMPFRYGIAVLTQVPHLFLELSVDVDGQMQQGLAADNLPPKWFVKNANETFSKELADMTAVITHACDAARALGEKPSVFELWKGCYEAQKSWAMAQGYPPLLWQFGLSLVERALIDAFCRAKGVNFAGALRANQFGIELGFFNGSLAGVAPASALPKNPLDYLHARHTVGLSDPLTDADISDEDRARDSLPQSLEATLDTYGLSYLKLKLSGDSDVDLKRLEAIAALLEKRNHEFAFTLDGNEQYRSLNEFKAFWQAFSAQPSLELLRDGLVFVEQPFGRDIALSDALKDDLLAWQQRPPIVIDESDAGLGSLAAALGAGYVGTSHKNCKGIFKSVANAALLEQRRLAQPGHLFIMSGEDLTNLGPVALQQDLAVLASLGIGHAERNGHHYFKGLSMFSDEVQAQVLAHHADLYTRHSDFVTVEINEGKLALNSVTKAPFGLNYYPDVAQFAPLQEVAERFNRKEST